MTHATRTATRERLAELAHPKRLPIEYQQNRRSVYSVDKTPHEHGDGSTTFATTSRLDELSKPKQSGSDGGAGGGDSRPPQWAVSEPAKRATASARVGELACARDVSVAYTWARAPASVVSERALRARASAHVCDMSRPLVRRQYSSDSDSQVNDLDRRDAYRPLSMVSRAAAQARCSQRVASLAASRPVNALYRPSYAPQWSVSETAMHAAASLRLQQLARPHSARLRADTYDPYTVPACARRARASPRVCVLAEPKRIAVK